MKPSAVAQVDYGAWTEDGLIRHASVKALREDKHAHQVGRNDGYRLQARIDKGKVYLLTRSGFDWTERFGGCQSAVGAQGRG